MFESHVFFKKQELGCDLVHVRMGIDFEMSVMFPLKGGVGGKSNCISSSHGCGAVLHCIKGWLRWLPRWNWEVPLLLGLAFAVATSWAW